MLRRLRRVRVSTWVLLAIFAGTLWVYLLVRPASPAANDSPLGTRPAHTSSPTPTPSASPRPTPSPTPRATQPSPTPRIRNTPSPTVGATPSPTTAGSPDPTPTDPTPTG